MLKRNQPNEQVPTEQNGEENKSYEQELTELSKKDNKIGEENRKKLLETHQSDLFHTLELNRIQNFKSEFAKINEKFWSWIFK